MRKRGNIFTPLCLVSLNKVSMLAHVAHEMTLCHDLRELCLLQSIRENANNDTSLILFISSVNISLKKHSNKNTDCSYGLKQETLAQGWVFHEYNCFHVTLYHGAYNEAVYLLFWGWNPRIVSYSELVPTLFSDHNESAVFVCNDLLFLVNHKHVTNFLIPIDSDSHSLH